MKLIVVLMHDYLKFVS